MQLRYETGLTGEEYVQAEAWRDRTHEEAEAAHKAHEEAERTRAAAEREHDQAQRDLALLRRKGKNPPCWYRIVSAGEGRTREKPYYAFNVAIYEDGIEPATVASPRCRGTNIEAFCHTRKINGLSEVPYKLAPRTTPPRGAFDDGGGPYADEWKRLRIEALPYGKSLSDNDFTEAVSDLVAQGRNRQVQCNDRGQDPRPRQEEMEGRARPHHRGVVQCVYGTGPRVEGRRGAERRGIGRLPAASSCAPWDSMSRSCPTP